MNARTLVLPLLMIGGLALPTAFAGPLDHPQQTNGFLFYHPDMASRKEAMEAYGRGDYKVALGLFRRASRFADKGSQAMLAEMYWKGQGVAQDRAMAYAFSDLAAERGYRALLAIRESYWQQLDAAEQARAIADGQAVYAEYGDDVAKPRMAAQLRRGLDQATGSRLGYISFLSVASPKNKNRAGDINGAVISPQDLIGSSVAGDAYYAPKYWHPQMYFAAVDAAWNKPHQGTVVVGPLRQVKSSDAAPANGAAPPKSGSHFE